MDWVLVPPDHIRPMKPLRSPPNFVLVNRSTLKRARFFESIARIAREETCKYLTLVDVFVFSYFLDNWLNGAKGSKPNCYLKVSCGSSIFPGFSGIQLLLQQNGKKETDATFVFCFPDGQEKVMVDYENRVVAFYSKDVHDFKTTFVDLYAHLIPHVCPDLKRDAIINLETSIVPGLPRLILDQLKGLKVGELVLQGVSDSMSSSDLSKCLMAIQVDKLSFEAAHMNCCGIARETSRSSGLSSHPVDALKKLTEMKCKEIVVNGFDTFKPRDFSALLEKWKKGSYSSLEKFMATFVNRPAQFRWESSSVVSNLREVCDGLDTLPWKRARREKYFIEKPYEGSFYLKHKDLRNGKDIVRADGTIGTLSVGTNSDVEFHVWKNPFPMAALLPSYKKRLEEIEVVLIDYSKSFIEEAESKIVDLFFLDEKEIPTEVREELGPEVLKLIKVFDDKKYIEPWVKIMETGHDSDEESSEESEEDD